MEADARAARRPSPFRPCSTTVTAPSTRAPAGIATRPAAITSRVTRAFTRSSTRARSEDRCVSSWSPITDAAGRMTSSNWGTRGSSGGGAAWTGAFGSSGAGLRPDGGCTAACGSGCARVPSRARSAVALERRYGRCAARVRAWAGGRPAPGGALRAESRRSGARPARLAAGSRSALAVTTASVSATGCDAGCADAAAGATADGGAALTDVGLAGSAELCRVATYAPPAAAVTHPRASRTNASGLENIAYDSLCTRKQQGTVPRGFAVILRVFLAVRHAWGTLLSSAQAVGCSARRQLPA